MNRDDEMRLFYREPFRLLPGAAGPAARERRRALLSRITLSIAAVAIVALAAVYIMWRPLHGSGTPFADLSAYYSAGRLWAAGGDPYAGAVWQVERLLPGADAAHMAVLPYVGPPLGLPLWAALGSMPYARAAATWGSICLACGALVLGLPAQLAGRRLRRRDVLALAVLFCTMEPIVDGMTLGQAALPATAAIAFSIVAVARRRWFDAGFAAFIAAALKPNLVLVLTATLRLPATLLAYAGGAAGAILGNLAFAGGAAPLVRYMAQLGSQTGAERHFTYQFTTTSIAYSFGAGTALAAHVGWIVTLGAIAALLAAIVWSRATLADGALIACAIWPLTSPFVHESDLSIVVIPALVAVLRLRGDAWIIAAVGTVVLSIDVFGVTQGRVAVAFSAVIAFVCALQLASLAKHVSLHARTAPLLVAPALVVLAVFAPAQPLPMWPAALPPAFRTSLAQPVSRVWHAELVAAGLESRRPYTALLRSVSLGGCLCIAAAMTVAARRRRRHDPVQAA